MGGYRRNHWVGIIGISIHSVLFEDRLNFVQFLIFAIGNTSVFFDIHHGFYLPVVQT